MGEQSVTIYAGNFAKFQVFQESLQASSSSSSIATVVEPSITKCLLTSSTKWIIDPGTTVYMTGNANLFSTPLSHLISFVT